MKKTVNTIQKTSKIQADTGLHKALCAQFDTGKSVNADDYSESKGVVKFSTLKRFQNPELSGKARFR
ncbi:MAG: hypothetical protein AAGI66_09110 [Cyanobacteria bacterium P01_H01_bin.74]